MKSVSQCFESLGSRGECALIPFIMAGDPDLTITAKALRILDQSGADIIELGVPYSDPLADGPVIQAAATRALNLGVKLDDVLEIVKSVRSEIEAPIILFTYYNPIYFRGVESFLAQIAAAGIQGLVIPDLPLEEAEALMMAATENNIEVTLLVAPTSSQDRIEAIAEKSQGFVYLVSVTGVTGTRTQVQGRVKDLLAILKGVTKQPIGVGFGISAPEQAQQIKQWGADAIIVGSAFVKRLNAENSEMALNELGKFCKSLKQAIL